LFRNRFLTGICGNLCFTNNGLAAKSRGYKKSEIGLDSRLLRCGISIPLMSLMGRLEISAARLLYP